jgi:hypothetical protein
MRSVILRWEVATPATDSTPHDQPLCPSHSSRQGSVDAGSMRSPHIDRPESPGGCRPGDDDGNAIEPEWGGGSWPEC